MTSAKPPWYKLPSVWIKNLYKWMLHWVETPYAVPALFLLALAESSCFPIPPDVLLIALAFSATKRSFYYATICSVGSVMGGLIGYAIGFFLWAAVGDFFLSHVISEELFLKVVDKYNAYSFWIVFTAAFTPIPYKIFTIAAGVSHVNIFGFFVASCVGRSMRFFIVATAMYFFGQKAKAYIEKYFELFTLAFVVLLILGFMLAKHLL